MRTEKPSQHRGMLTIILCLTPSLLELLSGTAGLFLLFLGLLSLGVRFAPNSLSDGRGAIVVPYAIIPESDVARDARVVRDQPAL